MWTCGGDADVLVFLIHYSWFIRWNLYSSAPVYCADLYLCARCTDRWIPFLSLVPLVVPFLVSSRELFLIAVSSVSLIRDKNLYPDFCKASLWQSLMLKVKKKRQLKLQIWTCCYGDMGHIREKGRGENETGLQDGFTFNLRSVTPLNIYFLVVYKSQTWGLISLSGEMIKKIYFNLFICLLS